MASDKSFPVRLIPALDATMIENKPSVQREFHCANSASVPDLEARVVEDHFKYIDVNLGRRLT